MTLIELFTRQAYAAGCSPDQVQNFLKAGLVLQPRQLAASAAARLCDAPDGPTAIGYGGARGGGKSHWLLAQMGVDDCQRVPELKCLLLRKAYGVAVPPPTLAPAGDLAVPGADQERPAVVDVEEVKP